MDRTFRLMRFVLEVLEDDLDGGRKRFSFAFLGIPQEREGQIVPLNNDLLPVAASIGGQLLAIIQMVISTRGIRAKEFVVGDQSQQVFGLDTFYAGIIPLTDQAKDAPGRIEQEDEDGQEHRK